MTVLPNMYSFFCFHSLISHSHIFFFHIIWLFNAAFSFFWTLSLLKQSSFKRPSPPISSHSCKTWRSMEVPLAASAGLVFVCVWVCVCGRLLLLALWWMMNLEPGCVLETGCASVLWSVNLMPGVLVCVCDRESLIFNLAKLRKMKNTRWAHAVFHHLTVSYTHISVTPTGSVQTGSGLWE